MYYAFYEAYVQFKRDEKVKDVISNAILFLQKRLEDHRSTDVSHPDFTSFEHYYESLLAYAIKVNDYMLKCVESGEYISLVCLPYSEL